MFAFLVDLAPSLAQLAIATLIVFGAASLQIATGMGFGMISAPLLVLIDPVFAPVPVLIVGLMLASMGAWPERANIVPAEIWAGLGGRVIGAVLAIGLLAMFADRKAFMLLFGSVTLFAIAITVFGRRVAFTLPNHWFLSTVSGVMGTITSVGAPPMAILYQGQAPEKVRPTLNALFFAGCVTGLCGLFAAGKVQPAHFVVAACFLPGVLAGIRIAVFFRTGNAGTLSALMLAVSSIAAVMLIYRGLS